MSHALSGASRTRMSGRKETGYAKLTQGKIPHLSSQTSSQTAICEDEHVSLPGKSRVTRSLIIHQHSGHDRATRVHTIYSQSQTTDSLKCASLQHPLQRPKYIHTSGSDNSEYVAFVSTTQGTSVRLRNQHHRSNRPASFLASSQLR